MSRIQSLIKCLCLAVTCLLLATLMVACTSEPMEESQEQQSSASLEAMKVEEYHLSEEGVDLAFSADLGLSLGPELVSAAMRGVPLNFVYEIKVTEPRWYFFQKEVAYDAREWRISYQPLLRQWSVHDSQGAHQEISLEDSLAYINDTHRLRLSLDEPLDENKEYTAKLRLRLDTTQLPGAFQFNLFNFRSVWSLSSEWQSLIFQTSTVKSNE